MVRTCIPDLEFENVPSAWAASVDGTFLSKVHGLHLQIAFSQVHGLHLQRDGTFLSKVRRIYCILLPQQIWRDGTFFNKVRRIYYTLLAQQI
jgi:hypothetical protein